MNNAALNRLSSVPWVATLTSDPDWTLAKTASRLPKASGEDSFFAETLASDRTIRSLFTFRPTHEVEEDLVYKEVRTVTEVGDGVNGYPQVCHGGFVATLLDEVCGILIVLNMEKKMERLKKTGPAQPLADMAFMTACACFSLLRQRM